MRVPIRYITLFDGELPIFSAAKSRSVHIWTPRKSWVRQGSPPRAKWKGPGVSPSSWHNALVPIFELQTKGLQRWLREKARRLDNPKGQFIVVLRTVTEEFLLVGIYHTSRPHPLDPWTHYDQTKWLKKHPYLKAHVEL